MSDTNFKGRVVFVSGAASGFGKILAERLAKAEARIILGDKNADGLEAVVSELRAAGADIVSRQCDVTVEAEVKALIEAGIAEFGRIDIAINNAGAGSTPKRFIETEEADLDFCFSVNTKGVFFAMKYQIIQMLSQGGGSILNISSKAGVGAGPRIVAYTASKHAVVGITKTAAAEYGSKNIRVNAICPFFTPTPMIADIESQFDAFASSTPMKRLGTPDEIVSAMLSVVQPDNSYMNGQVIVVDGGHAAY